MAIKVGVCIPHGGLVPPPLYHKIFALQNALSCKGYEFQYLEMEMAGVAKARNMLVEACTDLGVDLIQFIDDDVLLSDNAYLLYEHHAPIVSGFYVARQPPYTPQMYEKSTLPQHDGKYWPLLQYPEGEVIEVDAVGAGCLLVETNVFRVLQEAWESDCRYAAELMTSPGWTGKDPRLLDFIQKGMHLSPWFEFLDRRGEDFYFCEQAKKRGYRILCDTRVKCEHIGQQRFSEAWFLDARDRGLVQFPAERKIE